jgi:hypothetical protein
MKHAYVKAERLWLKSHPTLNEKWVQQLIVDDPSLLGLGDLDVIDQERRQPRAGRLDLLLRNDETGKRYEVEIQVGATDESHIIRTIEYWDIERRRYPNSDHCAVLIAEEVNGRFLNVMEILNGAVAFIAIQMQVFNVGENITIVFTKWSTRFLAVRRMKTKKPKQLPRLPIAPIGRKRHPKAQWQLPTSFSVYFGSRTRPSH